MAGGLTTSEDFLREAAKKFFSDHYQSPVMKVFAEVSPKLGYKPSLQFNIHSHLTVLVEVSETPYPAILAARRTDIEDLQIPIAVYCACPEEAYLDNQSEAKRLINHGFGLITIAQDGAAQRRSPCIPLIQRISETEFKSEIASLPPTIRRRLREAYDRYLNSAPSGVTDIAEVLEGFILKAGRDAASKGWIAKKDAKPGSPAVTLDAMQASPQFQSAAAAIGSVRGYVAEYRNLSHHFPKNKAQAAKRYRECRHAFLDGLKRVTFFRNAMRDRSLSGGL